MLSSAAHLGKLCLCLCLLHPATLPSAEHPPNTAKGLKRFRVGQSAPRLEGFASDGNVSQLKTNLGSVTLLTYWSLQDKKYEQQLERVNRIFKKYGARPDFKIVSFWVEDWPEYIAEMNRRGFDFYNSRNWWKLQFIAAEPDPQHKNEPDRIGSSDVTADRTPIFILLDKEHKFLAIDIPASQLEPTLDKYLNPAAQKTKPE